MDNLTEKKWFVYLEDRHEGPLSITDIQEKIVQGSVTGQNYVWSEGMDDWKIMGDTEPFGVLLNRRTPRILPASASNSRSTSNSRVDSATASTTTSPASPLSGPTEGGQLQGNILENQMNQQSRGSPKAPESQGSYELQTSITNPSLGTSTQISNTFQASNSSNASGQNFNRNSSRKYWKLLSLLLILAAGSHAYYQGYLDPVINSPVVTGLIAPLGKMTQSYLLKFAEKVPVLDNILSPLPFLESVRPEEQEELREAVRYNAETSGPRIAVAISEKDPYQPFLYLGTNLPDGAKFRIEILGIPHTLLNHLSFHTQVDVVIQNRIGKSPPIRFMDGKPIPRGEYLILVTPFNASSGTTDSVPPIDQLPILPPQIPSSLKAELGEINDSQLVAFKSYFLGGKRDAIYTSRLKDFHDKVAAKSENEIAELKQYVATLDSQLESTQTAFSNLLRNGSPIREKARWEAFHQNWMKLQSELHRIFQKWTPASIREEFYHSSLYSELQATNQGLEGVHEFQGKFFEEVADLKSLQIQLGEATSSTERALLTLKSKIDQIEQAPKVPDGIPHRELF